MTPSTSTLKQPLQRSVLAVPATSARFIEKAAHSAADAVFLDLEDAVAERLKEKARSSVIEALHEVDWGSKLMCVRVNALDTRWGADDLMQVAATCPRLDRIVLPKCDSVRQLHAADMILLGAELKAGRERPIGIDALIESASGIVNAEAIACASPRLAGLVFGAGDYQLDMGIHNPRVGAPSPDYAVLVGTSQDSARERHWNDPWHYALARVANSCRANGLAAIDGPFTGISDLAGYVSAARRAAALGFQGKWVIHPSQIEAANEIFSPSSEQLAWARNVLEALHAAEDKGLGAVRGADGEMIDQAHRKMAEALLRCAAHLREGAR